VLESLDLGRSEGHSVEAIEQLGAVCLTGVVTFNRRIGTREVLSATRVAGKSSSADFKDLQIQNLASKESDIRIHVDRLWTLGPQYKPP
jgi:hypothetical protein